MKGSVNWLKKLTEEIKTSLEGPTAVGSGCLLCGFCSVCSACFQAELLTYYTEKPWDSEVARWYGFGDTETTDKFSLQLMSAFLAQKIFFLLRIIPLSLPRLSQARGLSRIKCDILGKGNVDTWTFLNKIWEVWFKQFFFFFDSSHFWMKKMLIWNSTKQQKQNYFVQHHKSIPINPY